MKLFFKDKNVILELGGGQGWASCILKKFYLTNCTQVINSGIAKYAVESCNEWERIFKIEIDNLDCKAFKIQLKDNLVDIFFAFQAAHHFINHEATVREIYRILKPAGTCLYLNEPSCKKYIYSLAYKRVNKKRPTVHEDVIICNDLLDLAKGVGFKAYAYYDISFTNRKPFETLYYYLLNKIAFLKWLLPCGMDYVFRKS